MGYVRPIEGKAIVEVGRGYDASCVPLTGSILFDNADDLRSPYLHLKS